MKQFFSVIMSGEEKTEKKEKKIKLACLRVVSAQFMNWQKERKKINRILCLDQWAATQSAIVCTAILFRYN